MREARGDRTQTEIGHLLDAPQTTVSRWESGSVDLTVEKVHEIEGKLGLETGHLLRAGGYIVGEGMPGDPFSTHTTTERHEVEELLVAAELLGLGVSVTNRRVPSDRHPGTYTIEWEVRLHHRMPGDAA